MTSPPVDLQIAERQFLQGLSAESKPLPRLCIRVAGKGGEFRLRAYGTDEEAFMAWFNSRSTIKAMGGLVFADTIVASIRSDSVDNVSIFGVGPDIGPPIEEADRSTTSPAMSVRILAYGASEELFMSLNRDALRALLPEPNGSMTEGDFDLMVQFFEIDILRPFTAMGTRQ